MAYVSKNNAYSTLAAGITNVQTSLQVAAGHGDRFPVVTGSDYTYVTLEDASGNIEIVKVTARASASDTMTIVRAQESTTARAWSSGDVVEHRLTAGVMEAGLNAANDLATHLTDTADAHAASAITNTPAGNIAATTVQAALNELDSEKAAAADLTAHLNDTTAAHAASAISYAGGTGMSATDVEAAIDELATEKLNAADAFLNNILAKIAAYTVVAADRGKLIDCSGKFTLSLTAAATLGNFAFAVRNSGTGTITIDPDLSEQIDGATTITLAAGESCVVVCNATAFYTVGKTATPGKLSTATGSAPSYSARAWVNFNGTGTVAINAQGNVGSITDNGVGDYTINFTTAMPDANYAVFSTTGEDTANHRRVNAPWATAPTASAVRIGATQGTTTLTDPTYASVTVLR